MFSAPRCDEDLCCFSRISENSNLHANTGVNSHEFNWEPIKKFFFSVLYMWRLLLSVWARMCVGKRERYKEQISLHVVYCSRSDVVVSGLFYAVMVAVSVFSLGDAAVCSGKQYEFNLQWRRSSGSREGWRSAGTTVRRWSSWIRLEGCWGSKRTWHESREIGVNNML